MVRRRDMNTTGTHSEPPNARHIDTRHTHTRIDTVAEYFIFAGIDLT